MRNVERSGSIHPQESVLIPLTFRQQEVFDYTALGLSVKKIMGITSGSVNQHNRAILSAFRAYNMLQAIIKGVKTGNTDLDKATEGLDKNDILLKLSEDEREVLEIMTSNDGEKNENEQIASELHFSEGTIEIRVAGIVRKLGTNRTRAALLYIAYKRENTLPSL